MERFKVSIETVNGTKYYVMSRMELNTLIRDVNSRTNRFVKVPTSDLYYNVDNIVHIYYREMKEGESV